MCTALDIQDSIAPIIFGEKEVQFDAELDRSDTFAFDDELICSKKRTKSLTPMFHHLFLDESRGVCQREHA
jgi:hypothetical protein